eukprot:CAMPEP_0116547832 /NCGR_PEP_ID=MMETSP0397-20121206/3995_1 /TAXON_ID=216820 /ORGANISM="Cyclophora tenuis, Strain ECT3854" /LENGTH=71 /DNA_ID=CAMNT_0004072405 /DNA_START=374 /DNA_END=586 /DNA_ORIENTATION=-
MGGKQDDEDGGKGKHRRMELAPPSVPPRRSVAQENDRRVAEETKTEEGAPLAEEAPLKPLESDDWEEDSVV